MRGSILLFSLTVLFASCTCKNIFIVNSYQDDQDELLSVVALYRHGDRSPISSFPTDAYFDSSYWPEGYGQLLNKGKERQYQLGQWLRKRYNEFLPEEYSVNDIRVVSSDVDRTLMSAASNLAGLYPPPASQIWDENLLWEPIPIHTKPTDEDDMLAMDKECQKYNDLYDEISSSEYVTNITTEHAKFFDYVTKYTGRNTTTLGNIENLYSVFYVYGEHNASYIPSWADSLDSEEFALLAGINFALPTLTVELARLKAGPLLNYLIGHFDDIVNNVAGTPKFLMLSGHDTTISSVLNSMGAFDYYPPEFAATVLWEFRKSSKGTYYVNLLYKKTSEDKLEELNIKECSFNCDFENFKTNLGSVTINSTVREQECQVNTDSSTERNKNSYLLLSVLLISSFILHK